MVVLRQQKIGQVLGQGKACKGISPKTIVFYLLAFDFDMEWLSSAACLHRATSPEYAVFIFHADPLRGSYVH